jgi:hypothetical protein
VKSLGPQCLGFSYVVLQIQSSVCIRRKIYGFGIIVSIPGFNASGLARVSGSGFLCPMFWISRFGIRDSGFGVRVCGSVLKVQSVG